MHSQVSASDVGMCLCKVYFCHTDSIQDNKQNVSLTVDKCFAYSNFAVILRLIICLVFFFNHQLHNVHTTCVKEG